MTNLLRITISVKIFSEKYEYLIQNLAIKTLAHMYFLLEYSFLRPLRDTKNAIVKSSMCNAEYMNILPHTVIS